MRSVRLLCLFVRFLDIRFRRGICYLLWRREMELDFEQWDV